MKKQLAIALITAIPLTGCVGSAGIGADGSTTAGPETSVYRYTKTLADGTTATAEAVVAKKAEVRGLRFTSNSDGSVTMELESAESGDRQSDRLLDTANAALSAVNHIIGAGGLGAKFIKDAERKTARQLRLEARRQAEIEESKARAAEAKLKAMETELELIKARKEEAERLAREHAHHAE